METEFGIVVKDRHDEYDGLVARLCKKHEVELTGKGYDGVMRDYFVRAESLDSVHELVRDLRLRPMAPFVDFDR